MYSCGQLVNMLHVIKSICNSLVILWKNNVNIVRRVHNDYFNRFSGRAVYYNFGFCSGCYALQLENYIYDAQYAGSHKPMHNCISSVSSSFTVLKDDVNNKFRPKHLCVIN